MGAGAGKKMSRPASIVLDFAARVRPKDTQSYPECPIPTSVGIFE